MIGEIYRGWNSWENYLLSVLNAIDVGIAITDKTGVCTFVNEPFMKLTAIKEEDYVGKHVNEIFNAGFVNHVLSTKVIEQQKRISMVDKRNNRNLLITGVPLFNEFGQFECVINSARDVSDLEVLEKRLEKSERLQKRYLARLELINAVNSFNNIITKNPSMQKTIVLARRVAGREASVLILGETGVGKGLLAKCIHEGSPRSKQPFITIDCSVIPENLFESELFGYEPGSFTGAGRVAKPGLVELANGGTLFFDEIGELPLSMQSKLLRAIQDRQILRVGGITSIKVDFRMIAATNQDLQKMVTQKKFRQDLFYRLNIVPLELPPLRERTEDIILLVDYYLEKINDQYGTEKWFSQQSLMKLLEYNWPGNIRELANTIERLVIISEKDCIEIGDTFNTVKTEITEETRVPDGLTLQQIMAFKEKEIIRSVYLRERSSRKTAKALGISQSAFLAKLHKYGIELDKS